MNRLAYINFSILNNNTGSLSLSTWYCKRLLVVINNYNAMLGVQLDNSKMPSRVLE